MSTSARAEPPVGVHLEWQRPVGSTCPPGAVVQADVAALAGNDVFVARDAASVFVRGTVEEDPIRGAHVRIEATDARGHALGARDLHAASGACGSLRDAIAFVLTLFVEQYLVSNAAAAATRFGVGASAGLGTTPLPHLALFAGAVAALELGATFDLQARAVYWPESAVETDRRLGASVSAASLGLRACASTAVGLGICAGLEGGPMFVAPLALEGPAHQTRLLGLGTLQARWRVRLGDSLRVDAWAGPALSFSRPELAYRNAERQRVSLYRPPLFGFAVQLDFIILLPERHGPVEQPL